MRDLYSVALAQGSGGGSGEGSESFGVFKNGCGFCEVPPHFPSAITYY